MVVSSFVQHKKIVTVPQGIKYVNASNILFLIINVETFLINIDKMKCNLIVLLVFCRKYNSNLELSFSFASVSNFVGWRQNFDNSKIDEFELALKYSCFLIRKFKFRFKLIG